MKDLSLTMLAAGALFLGISGCSSSTTETTTTSTAEGVTETTTMPADNTTDTDADASTAPLDSTSFHALAASSDIFEVLSSVQAKAKAQHAEVKKFAEQMIIDHTKTSDELKQIAAKRYLGLPTVALARHQRMLDELTNEEDMDEFDDEYMSMQVKVHSQAVELFESAAENETDPELKAFAVRHLPHLRMHLDNAKRIKDMVK